MIPILYTAGETAFTSNGLGRLSDVIKCTVKEALNGVYELEMVYPVTGIHYNDIAEHTIISAYTDDTHTRQPFEVYRISRPFNRRVTINAWHISYRLRTMVVRPFTASTCSSAIESFSNSIMGDNPFTFATDKATNGSMAVVVPTVARSLMGGIEGSFIDTYGGEWEYNGFTCSLKNRRGTDTGVSIRYGKNLTDLKKITDTSNMFSGIVPYWSGRDENDQEIQVYYDGIIYAEDRSAFPYDKIIAVDASENFQSEPTQSELEAWGESYISRKGVTDIQKSIDVSFIELWQTEEYKNVAALQRLFIGDSVHVYYNALGVDNTARIVSYEYDVIAEQYNSMTLGNVKASLKSEVQADIDSAKASWGGNIDARLAALSAEIASTTVYLQGQIDAKIETWYQSADPSTAWTTAAERANHIGDLWYYTGESTATLTQNSTYRFSGSGWEEVEVSEDVFDKIDGKSAIFYGAPSGTYSGVTEGDYLVDSTDGSTYQYHNNAWVKVTDYGTEIAELGNTLQSQIDQKIETWYQSADPAASWTTAEKAQHLGDLWYYTGSSTSTFTQNATYRYSLSGGTYKWQECEASKDVFDEIDGKSAIFYGTPTGTYSGVEDGDYLVDSTDGSTYRRNNNQWVKVTDYTSAVETVENALQTQIDAKIETWYQSTDPASSWNTSALKAQHVGDLWFYTGSTTSTRTQNATYRYSGSGSSYSWTECEVSEDLFDAIDGKSTIFYGTPSETYTGAENGDYLVDNTDGSTYRRNNGQWVKVTDYNSVISSVETALQAQIDAKIETYYQSTDPASSWTTTALKAQHVGDLWFYTGSTTSTRTQNATYRYTVSGSTYSWTECEVSTEIFDQIDGKSTIFYGAPTGSYTGVSVNDYLVDPNTSITYRWSGSQWVKVTDWSSDIATAVSNATNLITGGLGGYVVINTDANDKPQEILIMDTASVATAVHVIRINKNGIGFSSNGYNGPFTNAWTIDGNLVADFITTGTMSANRIKGGTLSLGGAGNADGVILIYNASGQEIGRWDKDGIKAVEGVHLAGTIYLGYETANKKVYGVIDYRSFLFTDTSGNDFFEVADMRDTSGSATITDSFTGDGSKKNFLPSLPISSMTSVKVNGTTTSAYTWASNVVTMTTAPANGATVVITYKTTSTNAKYYTFGIRKTNSTKGGLSVAEGKSGEASGFCSHVEGDNCVASSDATHANGYYTTAASPYQTVIGAYNLVDRAGRYAFIIGNGSSSGRSNALTVTWAGDVAASGALTTGGDLTVGGTITSGIPMWKTVQKSVSVSVAAGSAVSILANTDEGDITKPAFDIGTQTGYTPVAAVKVTSGHNDLVIRAYNAEATGTGVMVAVRNVATASRTGTVTIEVLYLKNTYQA